MAEQKFLSRERLDTLLGVLAHAGYAIVGPRRQDGAIVFGPLRTQADLPRGVRDRQRPGEYRLHDTASPRLFGFANGPQALKPLFFASRETLWQVRRDGNGIRFDPVVPATPKPLAIIGARPCDLAALALHDAHFLAGEHRDAHYTARRAGAFLVAVNCTHPADTCFCASTGDGPAASGGYDLLLDELEEGFLIAAGSEAGRAMLTHLPTEAATDEQIATAREQSRAAAEQQRRLPAGNLAPALAASLEHPRWAETAARCLSCGNCTSVCPTCFCNAQVEDATLDGSHSQHVRQWDSCFTEGHSYIHGIVIRDDTRKRYRQWLTHKLGNWHAQYGRSGCVGCGRCIAWCPVGIDLTEEAAAIVGGKA
ncbi:MAG: 4Fe-4S dicluster domain-containing protein [Thiohalomonadaceae bacterium]